MATTAETEIKLRLDADAARSFNRFAARFPQTPKTQHLSTTYFVDKKQRLARQGLEQRRLATPATLVSPNSRPSNSHAA